jgi:hypothetical protein
MGPCCDLLMICSPRFSAYCGLMRATVLGSFANTKHSHRTEQDSKKTSEVERSVSGPSRDLHLGQNLRPAQATAIQELLSKNSLPRERYFVTRIVPRSPGRQLCRRGITRQKLPSLFQRRPRAGTLTSWM